MPEQIMKFRGGIEVSNMDQVKVYLVQEMKKLTNELKSLQKNNKITIPEHPTSVSINNLEELKQSVNALGDIIRDLPAPEVTVQPPKVTVEAPIVNVPDVIIPEIKVPKIEVSSPEVNVDLKEIVDALNKNLEKLSKNNRNNPLAVRLADNKGWVKAVKENTNSLAELLNGFTQYQTDSGRVTNAGGVRINPATEENQGLQNIVTAFVSTDNISAGATFTSDAYETLGVSAIQVFAYVDKNSTLYLDQGVDGSTWDITDELTVLANTGYSRIIYSVAPYFQVRFKNNESTATTEVRVAAGMTPIINPLPRALSDDQRLMTETTITGRHNSERHAWINPTNEQAISPVYRMVGTNFDGTTKDTNFWTELVDAGTDGSVTQGGGEIEMKTSTTATGWAKYTSVRKSRFVAGSAQLFSGGFNFKTEDTADNIRRVGAYTTTNTVNTPVDGFYFELNNSTFSVNSRANAGTVSSVASGSFNGEYGVSWSPTADTYYKLSIEWSPLGAFYYVNGKLLHKKSGAHQSYYMTLPITMENIYTSGSVDVNFETVGMYIARQGELTTNPTGKYLAGNTTTICKYGAGVLHSIVVSDNVGDVNIYDGLSTAGTVIALLDTSQGSEPMGSVVFMAPFNDGLTIETDGNVPITVIYE